MLRKSDWDPQKPGIILLVVHKLVLKERATKPETPDDRLLTPNPTNKLFQQTLIICLTNPEEPNLTLFPEIFGFRTKEILKNLENF